MNNLTVAIPYRDGSSTIERLLDSLPTDLPVLVVDDQSEHIYKSDRPNVRVIRTQSRGYFAGACNLALDATRGDVLILNQDVTVSEATLRQVAGWQAAGYAIAGDGIFGHPAWRKGYVQGTCMYLSRAAIEKVGAFNAVDFPLWGCTAEWQLRACRLGFTAHPCEVEGLVHERRERFGASIMQALADEPNKRDLFIRTPPLISVIVPCYNYGRYLPDAIHSLIGGDTSLGYFAPQTFQAFEIIIIDDKSTDDSLAIAQSFADDWKGIRVYQNEHNVGTAETFNAGIRQAFGRYISVMSADDMSETKRLDKMYRLIEQNPHSTVYDDFQIFKYGQRGEVLPMMEPYDFDRLLQQNQIPYAQLCPLQAWKDAGGYPPIFDNGREDWAFNVALGAAGYCGVHLREPLLLYRREQQNRSLTNSTIEWRRQFMGKMQTTFPNLYRGERTKMCCGSKQNHNKSIGLNRTQRGIIQQRARGANVVPQLVGAAGMVALEYLGQQSGAMPFTGAATGQAYLFGGKRRVGYVAQEDADGFLAMYHNQRQLFRKTVVTAPQPAQAVEVKAAEARAEFVKETTPPVADIVTEPEPPVEEKPKTKRGRPKKKSDD